VENEGKVAFMLFLLHAESAVRWLLVVGDASFLRPSR
jgi:hypothetical protein